MRPALVRCLTAALLLAPSILAGQGSPLHDLSRVRLWLTAVDRHQPGAADAAAKTIASLSDDDIDWLIVDLNALVLLAVRSKGPLLPPKVVRFTTAELEELEKLAEAERTRGINRRLRRAALLHTDIASLDLVQRTGLSARRGPGTERAVSIILSDGLGAGFQDAAVHWEFARLLLDEVKPDPRVDDTVRTWYRATSVYFAAHHRYSDALPHLERALRLFPNDAALLMDSGCVAEALAAPSIQNFVAAAVMPTGVTVAVRSALDNWRQAERYLRRAVELDDRLVEAHLRLGRVIGRQGRHADAVVELEKAARSDDPRMQYFAALFLGVEYHALNRVDRARASYAQALALYPRAQSPRLSTSQLARESGDRTGALDALQPVLEAGSSEASRGDPWWTYYDGPGGDVDREMGQMRAALYLADAP